MLEADETYDETDSAFISLISKETGSTSLAESILDFPWQHGRRYHSESMNSDYSYPNDDIEADRLDMMNGIIRLALGKLFLAPVDMSKVKRALDLGTGTGVWAIEFGDEYPNVEVTGVDISPIQPAFTSPNVKFEVDDVEKPWTWPYKFDFIFCRQLQCALRDWPALMRQTYDNLAPGGWVEFEDYDLQAKGWDHTVKDDDAPIVWDQLLIKACKQIGIEASPGEKLEKWVKEAGFVNVTHRVFKMPMNVWASDPLFKKIGGLMLINGLEGLEGFSLRLLCGVLGWTEAEVHLFLVDVRKKLKDRNWHGYWDYHVVYAQKPGAEVA